MTLDDIPIFATLKSRLDYLADRQQVIAQNVANSDTPGYTAMDLKPFQVPGSGGLEMVTPEKVVPERLVQPDGGNVAHGVRPSKLIRPPNFGKAGVFGNSESSAGVPIIRIGAACVRRAVRNKSWVQRRVFMLNCFFL